MAITQEAAQVGVKIQTGLGIPAVPMEGTQMATHGTPTLPLTEAAAETQMGTPGFVGSEDLGCPGDTQSVYG
jgi:hypothetical protein